MVTFLRIGERKTQFEIINCLSPTHDHRWPWWKRDWSDVSQIKWHLFNWHLVCGSNFDIKCHLVAGSSNAFCQIILSPFKLLPDVPPANIFDENKLSLTRAYLLFYTLSINPLARAFRVQVNSCAMCDMHIEFTMCSVQFSAWDDVHIHRRWEAV